MLRMWPDPIFNIELRPHRSLSPHGFVILMSIVTAIGLIVGTAFAVIGAWPVFGFFGLIVVLTYVAFRATYRSARTVERLLLAKSELIVWRVRPNGQVESWVFQPYWLRVGLDSDGDQQERLTLASHGRVLEIGKFLSLPERRDVALLLRDALRRQRSLPQT